MVPGDNAPALRPPGETMTEVHSAGPGPRPETPGKTSERMRVGWDSTLPSGVNDLPDDRHRRLYPAVGERSRSDGRRTVAP